MSAPRTMRTHGPDLGGFVALPLTKGQVALLDIADAERAVALGAWHASQSPADPDVYYARRKMRQPDGTYRMVMLHQFVLSTSLDVDHRNGDTLDNRRANLRATDPSHNGGNQRVHINNSSGYKGVTWDKRRRKWLAQISVGGRGRYLGNHDDVEAAARAYDQAAIEAWGEFACVNFPIGNQRPARKEAAV
jgi:hypothetical protein